MSFIRTLPRDSVQFYDAQKIITEAEKSRKLKKGECLTLQECLEDFSPYPHYLIDKLNACTNQADGTALEVEWRAFERLIAAGMLHREAATRHLGKVLEEALAGKRLKNGEAEALREDFAAIEGVEDYPNFLLSKLSEKHQMYLTQEKKLYYALKAQLNNAIAGASKLAALGKLSTEDFHDFISNLNLSLSNPNKEKVVSEPDEDNKLWLEKLTPQLQDLWLACQESAQAYQQFNASPDLSEASALDRVRGRLDKALQSGQLTNGRYQSILEYLDVGEEVPSSYLDFLTEDVRREIAALPRPAPKAGIIMDMRMDVNAAHTPAEEVKASGGVIDAVSNSKGSTTIAEVASLWNNIFIFHDAENTPLPKKTIKRDAAGRRVIVDGKVQFLDKHPNGLGDICFSDVYEGIVKTALRCALMGGGQGVSMGPAEVETMIHGIDVVRDLQITYHFLFSGDEDNVFHPVNSVMTGMHTRGVNVHKLDRKKGSVDVKLMELLETELSNAERYTKESLSKTLFVLLSGDRDFASCVRKARKTGIEVVFISSEDSPINRDFVSLLRNRAWAADNWLDIVRYSQRLKKNGSKCFVSSHDDGSDDGSDGKGKDSKNSKPSKATSPAKQAKVDDSNLLFSIPIESLHKAFFVKYYAQQRLIEVLTAIHPNLKVDVEVSKEVGKHVHVQWSGETSEADVLQEIKVHAEEAVKHILASVTSCAPLYLPGVSSEQLFSGKSEEQKELAVIQRSLNVSIFVRQQAATIVGASAPAIKNSHAAPSELIVEHPIAWGYSEVWKYCAEMVGVTMNTQHRPDLDEAIQKGAKVGNKRSKVKIFAKASDLEAKRKSCYSYQAADSKVFFVMQSPAPIQTSPMKIKDNAPLEQKNTSNNVQLPHAKGWDVQEYNKQGSWVVLSYFRGEEDNMNNLLNYLLLKTKIVAECYVEGAAKVRLCYAQFRSLLQSLEVCGLRKEAGGIEINWPTFPKLKAKVDNQSQLPSIIQAKLTLRGRSDQVESAMKVWNEKMEKLQVKSINIPLKLSTRFGLIDELLCESTKLSKGFIQQGKEDDNEEDADDDDDVASHDASSVTAAVEPTLAIGLYRTFPMGEGSMVLRPRIRADVAYFLPEDDSDSAFVQDQVESAVSSLSSVVQNYEERECPFAKIRTGLPSPVKDFKQFRMEVRKLGVSGSFVDSVKKQVLLSGSASAVEEAFKWLTELPEVEKVGSAMARAPSKDVGRFLSLTADGKQLLKDYAKQFTKPEQQVFVRPVVTTAEKKNSADVVLVVKAPKGIIDDVVQMVEGEIKAWTAAHVTESLLLSDSSKAQYNYLMSEDGSKLLKRIAWHYSVLVKMPNEGQVGDEKGSKPSKQKYTTNSTLGDFNIGGVVDCAVIRGTMLRERCAALVNAANEHLMHAGGLAKAIADAAGPELIAEGKQVLSRLGTRNAVPIGECVVTGAYNLSKGNPAVQHIIHAVGPRCVSGGSTVECNQYKQTVMHALTQAVRLNADSIAFPLMGSGIYRWPIAHAAKLLIEAVIAWVVKHGSTSVKRIVLIDFNQDSADAMNQAMSAWANKGVQSSTAVFPQPTAVQPHCSHPSLPRMPKPQYLWQWYKHEINAWVAYDYDQVLQIERAFLREGRDDVVLRGDVHGVVSDSKHIPEGETSAVYRVVQGALRCSYTRQMYEFSQLNIKSGYQRPVRREPFDAKRHKLFGYENEEDFLTLAELFSVTATPAVPPAPLAYALSDFNVTMLPTKVEGMQDASQMKASACLPSPMSFVAIGMVDKVSQAQTALQSALAREIVQSDDLDWQETAPMPWQEILNKVATALVASSLHDVEVQSGLVVGSRVLKLQCLGSLQLAKAMQVALELKSQLLMEKLRQDAASVWPEEWEWDDKDECDASRPGYRAVELQQGSEEWTFVEDEWRGSPSINGQPRGPRNVFSKKIVSIQRIQNPAAWTAYYNRVKLLASKNTKCTDPKASVFTKANEHWMKHGTRGTDPKIIAGSEYGLDFRYCDAGYFGRATYTADDAHYSHGYRYNVPNGKNHAQMFLVRVAAGNIFEVTHRQDQHGKMRTAPDGFHSVRGPVTETNKAIMVYLTDQAYPSYLITYEA